MRLLLDTHILIWWLQGSDRLSERQRQALQPPEDTVPEDTVPADDEPLLVSDISLWEIATLHSLGRLRFDLPLRDWLDAAVAPPLVRRIGISTAIAAEVAALPDSFHRDPADRILVATARVLNATLVTSDQRIVDAHLVSTL